MLIHKKVMKELAEEWSKYLVGDDISEFADLTVPELRKLMAKCVACRLQRGCWTKTEDEKIASNCRSCPSIIGRDCTLHTLRGASNVIKFFEAMEEVEKRFKEYEDNDEEWQGVLNGKGCGRCCGKNKKKK